MNFAERQKMWRCIGLFGLPTHLFAIVMQFGSLREVMGYASVNKFSRDTIYDHYYKCFTKFDLTLSVGESPYYT